MGTGMGIGSLTYWGGLRDYWCGNPRSREAKSICGNSDERGEVILARFCLFVICLFTYFGNMLVYWFIPLFVRLCTCFSIFCLVVYVFIYCFTYVSIYSYLYWLTYLSVHLFVYNLFIWLFVSFSVFFFYCFTYNIRSIICLCIYLFNLLFFIIFIYVFTYTFS